MAKTKVMVGIRFAVAVANDAEVKAKPRSENCCPSVPLFLMEVEKNTLHTKYIYFKRDIPVCPPHSGFSEICNVYNFTLAPNR